MEDQNKKIINIHERIYKFVILVLNFTKTVPTTTQNIPIINQVIRSATSIGANDREADGSLTKKDFIKNYVIVRKEAKETLYWLELLRDTNTTLKVTSESLIKECQELVRIISAIIKNTLT